MKHRDIIFPTPLTPGDTIAVCSPAGAVDTAKVEGMVGVLTARGWNVRVMPHALGSEGNYSASASNRLEDLRAALNDPDVRAIICSRGGYGAVQLVESLEKLDLRHDPKWVVGYSDICVLHALLSSRGIASVHASMAGHIMLGEDDPDNAALFDILEGRFPSFNFDACPQYDRPGVVQGRLVGGNMAVLTALIGTPLDIFDKDTILFIEDIAEPIYKIERMLYQLALAGILPNLKGLVVGQFTDYKPDRSYATMEQMIYDMVAPYSYPVAFNAPVGHVDHNIPMIENARVTLKVVGPQYNSLIFHDHA